jgi:hypothetical protein
MVRKFPRASQTDLRRWLTDWGFSRLGFIDLIENQSFWGSVRPLGALEPSKKVGGFAPHLFKWFESSHGPQRSYETWMRKLVIYTSCQSVSTVVGRHCKSYMFPSFSGCKRPFSDTQISDLKNHAKPKCTGLSGSHPSPKPNVCSMVLGKGTQNQKNTKFLERENLKTRNRMHKIRPSFSTFAHKKVSKHVARTQHNTIHSYRN